MGSIVTVIAVCLRSCVLAVTLPPMPGVGGRYVESPVPDASAHLLSSGSDAFAYDDWRALCDLPLAADLRNASGVAFDVFVSDIRPFSGCKVYLKSGGGWYTASASLFESDRWNRIVLKKGDFGGVEGKPEGWGRITQARICLLYADERETARKAKLEIRNFVATEAAAADVLVIRGDSRLADHPGEDSVIRYASIFSSSLDRLNVRMRQVSDLELTPADMDGIRLAVLPWNPSIPDQTMERLERFVAAGGKLIVCGAFPSRVLPLLGLRNRGGWYESQHPGRRLSGFLKCGTGLADQPDFVPQNSWQTLLLEPVGEGGPVAVWRDGAGRATEYPAIVRTPHGFSIGHVWFGDSTVGGELLAAMVKDAVPAYREAFAAVRRRDRENEELQRRWAAELPSKPDERRFMWCHSALGLVGRDWDGSVKFLKDNGFTDLIANLVWGHSTSYRSAIWPSSADVERRGDQFELCKAACRKYGIRLHVWQVCWWLRCGADRIAELKRDGRLQEDAAGSTSIDGGAWLCPTDPRNRREIVGIMVELARKGADGVHFDYIRYPSDRTCYCARCREEFEKRFACRVGNWPADLKTIHAEQWMRFRMAQITQTVRAATEEIHASYPGVEVSAAVLSGGKAKLVAQDWTRWCREGWVDFVCPMDYTDSTPVLKGLAAFQQGRAGKAKVYPGLGPSCWKQDGWETRRFGEQVMAVREAGCGGFSVFELNGGAAERLLPLFSKSLLAR